MNYITMVLKLNDSTMVLAVVLTVVVLTKYRGITVMVLTFAVLSVAGIKSRRYEMSRY